jgi:hypothetical protein
MVMALCLTVCLCATARTQSNEAIELTKRAIELYRAGNAGEAIPLAKRALEINEKALPTGHPAIALNLNNLAFLYQVRWLRLFEQNLRVVKWAPAG